MRKILPLFTIVLMGCATPHLEGTDGQDSATLARISSPDREARLVRVEGIRINAPASGGFFLKPGERRLQFQLQLAAGGPPGKTLVAGFTPQQEFLEACLDLKAGYDYLVEVDRSRPERTLVVNERTPRQSAKELVDSTC